MPPLQTPRLVLSRFVLADADEVFRCITPAVTRFMAWEPPSREAYLARCEALAQADKATELSFVIRRRDTGECLGAAAIERLDDDLPELGIWMKVEAHGQGYGREVVEALAGWATAAWRKAGFIYPVAAENTASRRIAEALGGKVIATRSGQKYASVVYRIPAPT